LQGKSVLTCPEAINKRKREKSVFNLKLNAFHSSILLLSKILISVFFHLPIYSIEIALNSDSQFSIFTAKVGKVISLSSSFRLILSSIVRSLLLLSSGFRFTYSLILHSNSIYSSTILYSYWV